jgi:hypothetical protein
MVKSSPWTKLLPPLGVVLALVLVVAAALLWLEGRRASGGADVGGLMAMSQAVRADARAAIAGDAAGFDALIEDLSAIESARRTLAANENAGAAVRGLVANAPEWRTIASSLQNIADLRAALQQFHQARSQLAELAPQLLAQTGNLVSALSPAELQANRSHLERFELTIESIRQELRALAVPVTVAESVQRLSGAGQYLDQIIRGLRGEDSGLGVASVSGQAAAASLEDATTMFGAARGAIAALVADSDSVTSATMAMNDLDAAAGALLSRYRSLELAPTAARGPDIRLPLILVGAGAHDGCLPSCQRLPTLGGDSDATERTQSAGDSAIARRTLKSGGRRPDCAGNRDGRHHWRDSRLDQLRDRGIARTRHHGE